MGQPNLRYLPLNNLEQFMKFKHVFISLLTAFVAVFATVAVSPATVSAHHPLVSGFADECVDSRADAWMVYLGVTSDDPTRGKQYFVEEPAGYMPSGTIDESLPFTRTVYVPLTEASYTETVTVSWIDGPTGVTGTTTVNRPPTCPIEPEFYLLIYCEGAGGQNGLISLTGTANGEPISFGPEETLLFPYENGQVHLVLMNGDAPFLDYVLIVPDACDEGFPPSDPPTDTPAEPQLPVTGSGSLRIGGIGGVLVLIGWVLVSLSKKNRKLTI